MDNLSQVRSLSFGIKFGVNDKELTKADKAVDRFKGNVLGVESNFKGMSRAADMAGNKAATSISRAGKETSQLKNKVKSTDSWLERVGKTAKKVSSSMTKGFSKAGKSATKMMNTLSNHTLELGAGATAGAGLIFKTALDASDQNELMNKFKVSFGEDNYKNTLQWAKNYADAIGRGRNETISFLADTQDLFSSYADNKKQAAAFSKQVVTLANDLASFQNKKTENVMGNLMSGLMGETQALKSLGIGITAAQIKTKAYEMGLAEAGSEVSQFAKMQATLAISYERSKNAIGDAQNTNDSFANQLKFLKGNLSDLSSEVGKNYVPSLGGALTKTNQFLLSLKKGAEQGDKTSKVIAKLIAGGTGILGLATALGTLGLVIPKVWGGLNNVYGAFSKLTGINGKVIKSFITARWQTVKLGTRLAWLRTKEIAASIKQFIALRYQNMKLGLSMMWTRTKAIGAYIKGQVMARWATLKTGASMIWAKSKAVTSFAWSLIKQGAKSAYTFAASLIKSAIPAIGSFAVSLYTSAASAIPALGASLVAATTATWGFTTALLANPITWVVGGIIGLGFAIYGLVKHWDTVTEKVKWFSAVTIDKIGALIGYVKKNPLESLLRITMPVVNLIEPINFAYEKARGWLATHTGLELPKFKIPSLPDLIGMVRNKASELWSWAKDNPVQAVTRFVIPGLNLIEPINWAYAKARDWLAEKTGLELPEFKIPSITDVFNSIKEKIRWLEDKLSNFDIGGSIRNGIDKTKDTAIGAVAGLTQKVRNYLPFSPAKEGPLSDLDKTGPGFVNTIASGIDKTKNRISDTISNMWTNVKDVSPVRFSPFGLIPNHNNSLQENPSNDNRVINETNQSINESNTQKSTVIQFNEGAIQIEVSGENSQDIVKILREEFKTIILEAAASAGVN
ncbi:hypothetical protein [Orenia marismortui]|uniref:Phage-related minor tail protein n=1 Tax=Orenia marismortui TaxID=46469 RepID=A0A4R8GE11_9FIRM|nr:hypothetical protein [Orenia marismortui]TDX43702.1 hypothetical protein C7959_1595 [Orenia marismortui]